MITLERSQFRQCNQSDRQSGPVQQNASNSIILLLRKEPYYLNFLKEGNRSLNLGSKLITGKMRTKLLGWLQKIALKTFNFSLQTLFSCVEILDQYLTSTNESPSKLQLIGCACLFIASKIHEEVIVAAQCYATASLHIFKEGDLFEREKLIFPQVNLKKVNFNVLKQFRFASLKCRLASQKITNCQTILFQLIKMENIPKMNNMQVISALIVLSMDLQEPITIQAFLEKTSKP